MQEFFIKRKWQFEGEKTKGLEGCDIMHVPLSSLLLSIGTVEETVLGLGIYLYMSGLLDQPVRLFGCSVDSFTVQLMFTKPS